MSNNKAEVKKVIDVIIPAYNAHNTIKRALASIAMQENAKEVRVTIVDDCSDRPYDDIAEIFSNMLEIQIVKMKKNGGPGVARQVGFDHTNGDFVTWMDADDTWVAATSLLMLKNTMINQNQDCVYGRFLEEHDDGTMFVHEQHMVWMFGKMYKRAFLNHYNIRFNVSRQNEDTGFNSVVRGCTNAIWYIPEPVYIWHFKPNSITRIKGSMYGYESGYKGYIDNMIWQIKELEKRFVNRNYILHEILNVMCTLYFFHEENKVRYPMNEDISMNWIRGFYDTLYKNYEKYVTSEAFDNAFREAQAAQNLPNKGIIPRQTIYQFMDEVKAEPPKYDIMESINGSTASGMCPEITPEDWPVEIKEYKCKDEYIDVDDDTNKPLYTGMEKVLEQERQNRINNSGYTPQALPGEVIGSRLEQKTDSPDDYNRPTTKSNIYNQVTFTKPDGTEITAEVADIAAGHDHETIQTVGDGCADHDDDFPMPRSIREHYKEEDRKEHERRMNIASSFRFNSTHEKVTYMNGVTEYRPL